MSVLLLFYVCWLVFCLGVLRGWWGSCVWCTWGCVFAFRLLGMAVLFSKRGVCGKKWVVWLVMYAVISGGYCICTIYLKI